MPDDFWKSDPVTTEKDKWWKNDPSTVKRASARARSGGSQTGEPPAPTATARRTAAPRAIQKPGQRVSSEELARLSRSPLLDNLRNTEVVRTKKGPRVRSTALQGYEPPEELTNPRKFGQSVVNAALGEGTAEQIEQGRGFGNFVARQVMEAANPVDVAQMLALGPVLGKLGTLGKFGKAAIAGGGLAVMAPEIVQGVRTRDVGRTLGAVGSGLLPTAFHKLGEKARVPKEVPNAPEAREIPQGRVGEHPRDGEVRPPTKAGGRGGTQRGPQVGRKGAQGQVQEAQEVKPGDVLQSVRGMEFKYLGPEMKGQGRGKPRVATGDHIVQGVLSGKKSIISPGDFAKLKPTSGSLQSTVIPGAEEFISQDVQPALEAMTKAPAEVRNSLAELFNPAGVAESSQATARTLRSGLGQSARSEELARSVLKGVRQYFTSSLVKTGGAPIQGGTVQWNHPAIRFIRSMEAGKPLDPDLAKFQPLADWMRTSREETFQKLKNAGVADSFIENYWPHQWQKPGRVTNYLRQLLGRRPFAGPESFRRQRVIPTFDDAIAQGLQPVTWNPVEQHLLHLHEMNRSLVAHDTWNYLKANKYAQFVRFGEMAPEGYAKVNDRIARAIEMQPTVKADGTPGAKQPVLRGEWYLPEPAARVLNNYSSPGLRGNMLYDAMHGLGNVLNQAQLGLSAFHLTFVGLDSAISHTAVGLQALSEGRLGTAAKNLAQGLSGYAIPKAFIRGEVLSRAYRNPKLDPASPIGKTIGLLERAGARVNQGPEYTNGAARGLMNALERHNYPGAALRLVPAAFEIAAKPVMELAVPRLKLGVAETMIKSEIERLGPKATNEQITAAAQKAWDSVDNRMGQLVYDNLFWHNYLKQGGQLAQRSLGWNLGSVREIGGAVKDVGTTPFRMKAGEKPITGRMAYAVALPLQVALVGSILYRLYNGKNPPTLKDALQPTINGERWQIASYMRDITPLVNAMKEGVPGTYAELGKRAVSKLNPSFASTNEFLRNQDYWGNPIYGERGKGIAKHFLEQFTPFSLREGPKRPSTREEKWRQFFGFTRAPKEKTLAEQQFGQGIGLIKAAEKAGYKPKSGMKRL